MVSNTKLDWDFLKQFNFDKPPRIILGRSSIVNDRYNRHKRELKELEFQLKIILIQNILKNLMLDFI